MNEEILQGIKETQELQTNTIKELLEICEILKYKIDYLENKVKSLG